MDCGPAALKCLLDGHGIHAAYGRLREACQTEVDGTSIDTLEEIANELGLDAKQSLVPIDHVAHRRSSVLPAIVVVRLPSGANHFVVAWRIVGRWLQIMDPGSGRRWVHRDEFARGVYEHALDMPASEWRRWASSEIYLGVVRDDLRALGHRRPSELVERATSDATWRSLAALDASVRMTRSLVHSGGVDRGSTAARLVESLFADACSGEMHEVSAIPPVYWTVRPHAPVAGRELVLNVRGAVVVRVRGVASDRASGAARDHTARDVDRDVDDHRDDDRRRDDEHALDARRHRPLSPELAAALSEPPARPLREILQHVQAKGWLNPAVLVSAAGISAALFLAQALLFRALFDIGEQLSLREQRIFAFAAVLLFLTGALLIELPLTAAMLRTGRQLEARLRIAFQRALPRLSDRYFSSRPSSDMAERAHSLAVLRNVPNVAMRVVRATFQLMLTAAGLIWLDPKSAPLVVAAALATGLLPLVFQRVLSERELAVRSHHGALMRFYLESLLGIVAVRAHRAEKSLRGEHESLLVEWVRTGRRLARASTAMRAATTSLALVSAAWLVTDHFARHGWSAGELLFAYWALGLPALGDQVAQAVLQLVPMRNAALRALEPLHAPASGHAPAFAHESVDSDVRAAMPDVGAHAADDRDARDERGAFAPTRASLAAHDLARSTHLKAAGAQSEIRARDDVLAPATLRALTEDATGVALELRDVELAISGRPILRDIDLSIRSGEHVALVGASGAGKSSLIALLLGFHRASSGAVLVDGHALDPDRLHALREACAWIDPAVQLWNRTLFDNLVYGIESTSPSDLADALENADLAGMFESLPDGLHTTLGEGGAFLSGGEGQRVRFGRALLRRDVRLALLDEPFRGLGRERRSLLLERARSHWRGATLVCATHDLEETRAFDRVIVLDHGRIVEDGDPRRLSLDSRSHYRALLDAERRVRAALASDPTWTRWHVANGTLEVERSTEPERGSP
jgi:ATP-binding cassette subfamily B protein